MTLYPRARYAVTCLSSGKHFSSEKAAHPACSYLREVTRNRPVASVRWAYGETFSTVQTLQSRRSGDRRDLEDVRLKGSVANEGWIRAKDSIGCIRTWIIGPSIFDLNGLPLTIFFSIYFPPIFKYNFVSFTLMCTWHRFIWTWLAINNTSHWSVLLNLQDGKIIFKIFFYIFFLNKLIINTSFPRRVLSRNL